MNAIASGRTEEVCRCLPFTGLRSTHCPVHGSCTCCHGCTCPMHNEPAELVPVRTQEELEDINRRHLAAGTAGLRVAWPSDAAQCDGCGGNGCDTCEGRGWLSPEHPRVRRCMNDACGMPLPPEHTAVYCSNACAADDA